MKKITKYIKFDLSFVIVLIFSLFTSSFMMIIFTTLIILIHEMFHLLSGLVFKIKPKQLTITALGGIIELPLYKLSPIKKVIVSISGIISNIIIIIILYIFKNHDNFFINTYYDLLLKYNYSLIFFSLLPIYPLDGYNILQGIIEKLAKQKLYKGLDISRIISFISILILFMGTLFYRNIGFLIIIIFLIYKNIVLFKRKDYIYLQIYQRYLTT